MLNSLTLINTVTRQEIAMDQEASLYLLDQVDLGTVDSNHQSFKYINQIGVYVTGSTLETRDVQIVGWITGTSESELELRRDILNRLINPLQMIQLIVKDYRLYFLPRNSIRYSVTVAENNDRMCRFLISGFCPDPLFSSAEENRVMAATTYPRFRFPLRIPESPEPTPPHNRGIIMGLREPSLLVDIFNNGDVPTGMRIEFRALGTVLNPSLTNAQTLEFIKINKTMTTGERIHIVTSSGQKRVTGIISGVSSNYYKYRDLNSSWLQLEVGGNLFRYDAEGNRDALEVTIFFDSRFLEVQ